MEVHAHTHTPRKKWTHYFWEFLMLFLAISLGFLVENGREHFVEHKRAKIYAANLYEELKKDTSRMNELTILQEATAARLDTLCQLLKTKDPRDVTSGMIYYYALSVLNVEYYSSNNTTVEQLKGSGNLRIMGNAVAYKISEYDKLIRELEREYGLSKAEFSKMEDLHFRIIDVYISESLFYIDRERVRDSVFHVNDLPVSRDPDLLKQYIGWVKFESGIYKYQVRNYLVPLKRGAIELLALLKKEYHLE